jgi:hypothetical protein
MPNAARSACSTAGFLLPGIIRAPFGVRRLGAAFTPESTPPADPPPKRWMAFRRSFVELSV